MAFCWEVYQKSECDSCQFFTSYQSGNYDLNKIKDIIIVDDELVAKAAAAQAQAQAPQTPVNPTN